MVNIFLSYKRHRNLTFLMDIQIIEFITSYVFMELSVSLDHNLIAQICNVLDDITTPDSDTQSLIFKQFQNLHAHVPDFCFYLVFILNSPLFSLTRRYCAILVLKRNISSLKLELIPAFIDCVKPILNDLLKNSNTQFKQYVANLYCSIVITFGIEYFPEFYNQIMNIFMVKYDDENQMKSSLKIGLQYIEEMVNAGKDLPNELLMIIPQIIKSPLFYDALVISYSLLKTNMDFVLQYIIQAILESYTQFDEKSMAKAAGIMASIYLYYDEDIICQFIIQCLYLKNQVISESLLCEFSDPKSLNPNKDLIFALLAQMEVKDPVFQEFGPCSMAQTIVQQMNDYNGDIVSNIVKEFLPITVANQNVGHFLRCIYTILSTISDSQQYLQIILDNLKGDCRGDAIMCLMSFCFSNNNFIDQAIATILPYLVDEDSNVRCQAHYSLEELVEFEFNPNFEQFFFLINLLKETGNVSIAHLASRYSQHFPVVSDKVPMMVHFYYELIEFFLNHNSNNPIYQDMVDMLALFILIIKEPYESFNKNIFPRLMVSFDEDLVQGNFNNSIFLSYTELSKSLLKIYGLHFYNENSVLFKMILDKLTSLMNFTDNIYIVQNGFEIIYEISKGNIPIILDEFNDIKNLILRYISCKNDSIFNYITGIVKYSLPTISTDYANELLMECIKKIKSAIELQHHTITDEESFRGYKILGLMLVEFSLENGIFVDNEIKAFLLS